MVQNKKQIAIIICMISLVILLGGVAYAFFNYTRIGTTNNIKVGRISFISNNEETINLENLFPIDPEENGIMDDSTKVGTYSIDIKGDTDYVDGIEYLVSTVDSDIYTSTGKIIPISLDIEVDGLGTENANYYTARESKNANIYKRIVGDTLVGDEMLLVGYIKPDTTSGTAEGVDGSITIKAYLDKNKILISDTYDGNESDNMGTSNSMAAGKTVFTTSEWNALQTSSISFKVKVEANEGIWVIGSLEEIIRQENFDANKNRGILDNEQSTFVSASTGIDFGAVSSDTNGKGVYTRAGTENDTYPIMYYRGNVTNNNVKFGNYCWKAVRTTDTGGVKLIYNGIARDYYAPIGEALPLSSYTNATMQPNPFTFDSTDNSWNVTITDSSEPSIAFSVPAGSNYSLVMTGTSGSNADGQYIFFKNGTRLYYGNAPGGQNHSYTQSYGNLAATDIVVFEYYGYGTVDSPVTFKIMMEENSVPLSEEDYTILNQAPTFDSTENKWVSSVPPYKKVSLEFGVSESGTYTLYYNNPGVGPFYVYKNDNYLTINSGFSNYTLSNLQTTDKIRISFINYDANSNRDIEFYLVSTKLSGITCDNSSGNTYISQSGNNFFKYSVNGNIHSPAYVGYMYGTPYTYSTSNWTSDAYFGSGFTWDGENYKLTDASVTTPDATHHYSCNSTNPSASCASIRYVFFAKEDGTKHYITITGGKGVEEALEEMNTNTNNSNAKTIIDSWYSTNMINMTNRLEDTVWCNDRSIATYNGWSDTGNVYGNINDYKTYAIIYGADSRGRYAASTSPVKNKPSLECVNKNDRFTVSNEVGNKALDYPVALLTADEAVLAGYVVGPTSSSYLSNAFYYWLMSPANFTTTSARGYLIDVQRIESSIYSEPQGLRPSISIKPGQLIVSGTGEVNDPYIIN